MTDDGTRSSFPLDAWIQRTSERLSEMSRYRFALWFAYAAERLIPLYASFVHRHAWGDAQALRQELDRIWDVLCDRAEGPDAAMPDRLAALVPSGESFDAPDSTYAQDAVICVDAAARALVGDEDLSGDWAEFAVEPVCTMASIRLTGFLSAEGDDRADWEQQVVADPAVASFLSDLDALANLLARGNALDAMALRRQAAARPVSMPA